MSKEMSWRRRIHHNRRSTRSQPTVRHMLIDHAFMWIATRGAAAYALPCGRRRGYIVSTKSRLAVRRPLIKMTLQSPLRRGQPARRRTTRAACAPYEPHHRLHHDEPI
jgi:hypothetical protein